MHGGSERKSLRFTACVGDPFFILARKLERSVGELGLMTLLYVVNRACNWSCGLHSPACLSAVRYQGNRYTFPASAGAGSIYNGEELKDIYQGVDSARNCEDYQEAQRRVGRKW
ncbi:uncharacterized protein LOC117282478 [Cryptotermes secundus]|uniref:uncharacterized protein LOC117282478 n=1 Tax=Cryptotermes secundus TaxID=105785 RepID=UPI001454DC0E|nr:uncharacterized protein LOC117282478 [Cryptotermes secundus]